VTAVLVALDAALTLLAGAGLVGLLAIRLGFVERVLIALVAGVITGSAATYGLALLAGLNAGTVLGGPAVVALVALVAARFAANPWSTWKEAWGQARGEWARRPPYLLLGFTAVVIASVTGLFVHTIFATDGALSAGYPNVWADWSQHLTTQASFAVAANLPPENPLFSGTSLLYPFLPDFHSASLVVLGMSPGAAMAAPGAILAIAVALLIVCLAQRFGIGVGAGIIAAAICFLGGGLGFVGVFADACAAHGFSAAQCSFQHVVTNPGDGLQVALGTLHDVPGIIAAQPRPYDGDLVAASQQPLPNMQWYTPLFAWWLPQRALLYGFAAAVSVLILVRAALSEERQSWPLFVLAGLLVGLLPLEHVQTLIVLVVLLGVLAVVHRRREWLALLAVSLVIGLPRVVQLAVAPHGSVASGNAYPWFEPGWLANAGTGSTAVSSAVDAVGQALGQVVSPRWWGFWFVNLGLAVPLCALTLVALAARLGPPRVAAAARSIAAFMPRPLLELFLGAMLVFAACNLIVFQSWDWDNTKLFLYWYLAVALVVGALATHAWRRWFVRAAAALVPATMLITGVVVVLRLLPWTPPDHSVTGPYQIVSADEQALAARLAAVTSDRAIFLTSGRPGDPILTVAGRTAVMGYYGWVWSYGIDVGTRPADEHTMYAGCPTSACPIVGLLHQYRVDYVEIDDRVNDPGAITTNVNAAWWSQQGFPVVARSEHIVIYDVRHAV
jgi:hypothetical protein